MQPPPAMLSMKDNGGGGVKRLLRKVKPYAAMVLLQFGFAVMYVVLMATLKEGMNQSVMFVYRGVVAAVVMAPFALWLERNGRPKITLVIFIKVFALGILQPVLDQNAYFMGAKETSTSFASALENINPAITFTICLILRVEKLNIRQRHGLAKVIGALLCVIGAILMILYKGPFVKFAWSKGRESHSPAAQANNEAASNLRWIKGTFMVLVSCFSWVFTYNEFGTYKFTYNASKLSFLWEMLKTYAFIFFSRLRSTVLDREKANTLKSYPTKLSLTVMVSSIGAIANTMIALVVEHGSSKPWILGWDMRLFAVIYSGLICTALMHFLLGEVMKEKGPVFASAFNPLTMIITNILSAIFLAERTALGMIIGANILVVGMYSILWGKSKDHLILKENEKTTAGYMLPIVTPNNIEGAGSGLRSESRLAEIRKTEKENPKQIDCPCGVSTEYVHSF